MQIQRETADEATIKRLHAQVLHTRRLVNRSAMNQASRIYADFLDPATGSLQYEGKGDIESIKASLQR